jgi:hypothetical protein
MDEQLTVLGFIANLTDMYTTSFLIPSGAFDQLSFP